MAKHGAKTAVPRLRFPEFYKASSWNEKTLASVCDRITQGGTPDTAVASYWDGDVAWITPAEMGKSDDPHVGSTVRHITGEGLQACSSALLPVHSVIISTRAPIGHLAINTVPMAINQGCKGLVPGSGLDYRFLLASLLLAKPRLTDLGAGNTFKELSASALKSFTIGLPSRVEQQKIADCLTSLDEVIAAQGRKVEALKAHKRGLMQQLFPREGETRPRLRFPEFRDAPEWEQGILGDVCEVLNSRRIPISSGDRRSGRIPYYGASGVVDFIDNFIFDERLLLVGEDGAKWGAFEETAFIAGGKYWVNNHAHVLKPLKVVDTLLASYLTMIDLAGYVTGHAPPKLTLAKLKSIAVVYPQSTSEQQRIADCLSSLDTRITAESNQLTALKTHKQGLMQQLFPASEAAQA